MWSVTSMKPCLFRRVNDTNQANRCSRTEEFRPNALLPLWPGSLLRRCDHFSKISKICMHVAKVVYDSCQDVSGTEGDFVRPHTFFSDDTISFLQLLYVSGC